MIRISRLFDFPQYQLEHHPLDRALTTKYGDHWKSVSTQEFIDLSHQMSQGLLNLGITKGDKIAIISEHNSTEWSILDMALLQIGAISVPIYPTLSQKDYAYILNHCGAKFCFLSQGDIAEKIDRIIKDTALKHKIYFEAVEGEKSWNDVLESGKGQRQTERVNQIKNSIVETDLATIIYTSGTMGKPKGVMLSHKNIVSNVNNCAPRVPFQTGSETALSFLPCCHVFERMLLYLYMNYSVSIYFAESIEKISDNIKEVHPTVMTAVPRVIEKTYETIWNKGQDLPLLKRKLFNWAVNLGEKYRFYNQNSPLYNLKLKLARRLIFSQWKKGLGGNLNLIVSGSAALQERYVTLFAAAGIQILEGYGLSESAPVVSVNNPKNHNLKLGSVGKPLDNQEVIIAEDGEIWVRGDNVMLGYYKNAEQTDQTITADGFLKTGDVGKLDNEGFLYITDRKKKIFKTSGGKYIAPNLIESALKKCALIEQVVVIGEGEKMPAAIIQPNFPELKKWLKSKNIPIQKSRSAMIAQRPVIKYFEGEIEKIQTHFGEWEKIKRFELTPDEWTVEGGQLTPTLKVRRHVILKQYKDLINSIYRRKCFEQNP